MGIAATVHLFMMVQADIKRNRADAHAFLKQAVTVLGVLLHDAEFGIRQFSRLIEHDGGG